MPVPSDPTLLVERRSSGHDRRSPRNKLKGALRFGRRRQLRRLDDRRRLALLDHYPKSLMFAAVAVLLLSLGDAVLTLFLLGHGAVELNPIMDRLIKAGPHYFVLVKYGLTAAAATIVLLLNHYPLRFVNIPARSFLGVFTLLFSAVIAWQLYLVGRYVL